MANTSIKALIAKYDPPGNTPDIAYEFSNGRRFYTEEYSGPYDLGVSAAAILDGDGQPLLDGDGQQILGGW